MPRVLVQRRRYILLAGQIYKGSPPRNKMIQPPWPPPALEPLVSEHVEEGAYPFRWKHHKRWGQVVWPGVGTDDESVVQAMQAAEAATVAFNSGRKCALGSPELARHFSTAWKLIKTAEIGDPYNAPILKASEPRCVNFDCADPPNIGCPRDCGRP